MSFIKPLHSLSSLTSTNLLLSKTFPVAAAVKLRPFHSESDSTDTDLSGYAPNPSLNSEQIKSYFVKEEEDVVKAKVVLPGIGQKDVEVWVNKSVLFFKATTMKAVEEEDVVVHDYDKPRCYSGAIRFRGPLKLDEVKAKMMNGVLELVIPKIRFQRER